MKRINSSFWWITTFLLLLVACRSDQTTEIYKAAALTTEGAVQAVIEIPAGTNRKIEFNPTTKTFESDQLDGQDRIIDFLPYPGNYGFIPSTMMDKARGGDGDALDILVLAAAQPTGTLMAVKLIAALELIDNGELDTKIIAIPVDSSLQVIHVQDFESLMTEYNGAMRVIETWFLNYKGIGQTRLKGWQNEHHAMLEIKKWSTQKPLEQ